MQANGVSRIVAVLIGAGVVFCLEQGLNLALYIAIPLGVLAYLVTLVGLGLMLGTGKRA
ncbi:MAG TPA: hypothetical protein VHT93_01795 [Pseudolabrys sp.]|jgi:hypothetical protein|nr:hypothetical protein [Pseudolabrys sp.]